MFCVCVCVCVCNKVLLKYKGDRERKIWNASRICVSSLPRGHANLLCIVPILVYVLPKQARGMCLKHIGKDSQPESLCPMKISFKNEGETKIYKS